MKRMRAAVPAGNLSKAPVPKAGAAGLRGMGSREPGYDVVWAAAGSRRPRRMSLAPPRLEARGAMSWGTDAAWAAAGQSEALVHSVGHTEAPRHEELRARALQGSEAREAMSLGADTARAVAGQSEARWIS